MSLCFSRHPFFIVYSRSVSPTWTEGKNKMGSHCRQALPLKVSERLRSRTFGILTTGSQLPEGDDLV